MYLRKPKLHVNRYGRLLRLVQFLYCRPLMKHSEKMSVQFLSDIDPCHPNPCQNDGICKDVQGKVQCECKPPHKGTFCTGQFLVTLAWDASYGLSSLNTSTWSHLLFKFCTKSQDLHSFIAQGNDCINSLKVDYHISSLTSYEIQSCPTICKDSWGRLENIRTFSKYLKLVT